MEGENVQSEKSQKNVFKNPVKKLENWKGG